MGDRDAEPGDAFLLLLDERVKQRHLAGVLALLVLAEAEQVRFILRTPAVEVEAVLLDDGGPELLGLVEFGNAVDPYALRPFFRRAMLASKCFELNRQMANRGRMNCETES